MSKKQSILEELSALPSKGCWPAKLTKAQRSELNEVRDAYRAGKLQLSRAVLAVLLKRYSLDTTSHALRQWLVK